MINTVWRSKFLIVVSGITISIIFFLLLTTVNSVGKSDYGQLTSPVSTTVPLPTDKVNSSSILVTPTPCTECEKIRATAIAQKAAWSATVASSFSVTLSPTTDTTWKLKIEPIRTTPKFFPNATSLWHVGLITSADKQDDWLVYLWAQQNEASKNVIGRYIDQAPTNISDKYSKTWTPPQDLAAITITDVTDPEGIVSFRDANGKTGSLDIATGKWTFNN